MEARQAMAEILQAEQLPWAVGYGPQSVVQNTELMWRLRLRVNPEGEEPFEAEATQSWPQLGAPRVGQTVAARYDPADPSKVSVDLTEAGQTEAAISMVDQRVGADKNAMLQQMGLGSVDEIMREAMSDPQGFAAKMQERAAAMQQAAMAQAAAVQQAARAQAAAMKAQSSQAAQAAQAKAANEDPVDRLVKLADLHDRGVLTDAEFEAQKKRVLGE